MQIFRGFYQTKFWAAKRQDGNRGYQDLTIKWNMDDDSLTQQTFFFISRIMMFF